MIQHYTLTPLEQWIEDLYKQHNFMKPSELTIIDVASRLNIWTYFLDSGSQAIERNGLYSICVDRRLSRAEQWEDFLHELCHVLRHSGNQIHMPNTYTEMQEIEANNFVLYASLPYYMIKELSLPNLNNEAIDLLIETFGVTHILAQRRLEQIQRRVLQGTFDYEVKCYTVRQQRKFTAENWSPETKAIMDKLEQLKSKGGNSLG